MSQFITRGGSRTRRWQTLPRFFTTTMTSLPPPPTATTTTTTSTTNTFPLLPPYHPRRRKEQQPQPIEEIHLTTTMASNQELVATLIRPFVEGSSDDQTKKGGQRPVVLRGGANHFPAIQKWSKWEQYFQHTLPSTLMGGIEMGGSYSHETSQRAEIPVHDYLTYLKMFQDRHGGGTMNNDDENPWKVPTDVDISQLVYMAQNELPTPLYEDIIIPTFCSCDEDDDEYQKYRVGLGRLYSVMWWVGPRTSTSPLHFDPLDNLLIQIVGRKVIWLFPPTTTTKTIQHNDATSFWHYAGHSRGGGGREGYQQHQQQSNTSPINPEEYYDSQTQQEEFPLFAQHAPSAHCTILFPGDILYIPSKWWHYIRAVDTSSSVNIWWR